MNSIRRRFGRAVGALRRLGRRNDRRVFIAPPRHIPRDTFTPPLTPRGETDSKEQADILNQFYNTADNALRRGYSEDDALQLANEQFDDIVNYGELPRNPDFAPRRQHGLTGGMNVGGVNPHDIRDMGQTG